VAWAPEPIAGAREGSRAEANAAAAPQGRAPADLPAQRRTTSSLTALEALRRLESGPRGLVEAEAEERLRRYGENVPPGRQPLLWPGRLARCLRDPFTALLLALGVVSALASAWGTACVITVLVAVSCVLRTSGEHRADRSMAGLRKMVATTASVLRRAEEGADPVAREIPVDQLVPGDVIRLGPGELVPADVLLLRATGLSVHQAALTGEAGPVARYPVTAPAAPAREPAGKRAAGDLGGGVFEQPQLCFQGSSVASGSGTAVVLATGGATQFAGAYLDPAGRHTTAFDRAVNGVSWTLVRFMLLTPPLILLANAALRGRGVETLPFAVAVAVGLTPEMLPVVVTTALARGATTLARGREVIVKRLPALHDLGAMDILCTDKTGTLTRAEHCLDRSLDGEGRDDAHVAVLAAVNSFWTLQLADLPSPDPLDEALLEGVGQWESDPAAAALWDLEGVAALPFDPVRRLSCAVLRSTSGTSGHTLVVKGAVEEVLDSCARWREGGRETELDEDARERLRQRAASLAEEGLRLLAVARAQRPARLGPYTPADVRALTFEGLVAVRDTVAPTAVEAVAALGRGGVAVKVLTGDHPGTARRICQDLGLEVEPRGVLTGALIDALSDEKLGEAASRCVLFARCTPEHKARVITALRARGHTTGFLGDGVNDLPALHTCDVGICPRDAAEVTREAADVVLAEKDLTALGHAISTGRRSNASIAGYLRAALSSNLGNVIAMLVAGLLLPFLPMLPSQVLLQNLCFDAAQLAFAFDRPEPGAWARPTALRPRGLLGFLAAFGLLNAVADLTTFWILAVAGHGAGHGATRAAFHSGWFTENLLTQGLVMLLLRGGRRSGSGGGRRPCPMRLAALGVGAVGLLLPLSPQASALGLVPLPLAYYLLLAPVLGLYGLLLAVGGRRYEARAACSAPRVPAAQAGEHPVGPPRPRGRHPQCPANPVTRT
jgi:Mg2+-importing ATPase